MKQQFKIDFLLITAVLLLVIIGTSMIFSASSVRAKYERQDSNYFLKQQLLRILIGLTLMVIFYFVDYRNLQDLSWLFWLGSLLLLVVVLFVGTKIYGSRRSFTLMGFALQPSELAKYNLILFLSWFLARKGKHVQEFTQGLLPALIVIGITIVPILREPDLGTSVLILAIAAIMLFTSGVSLYHFTGLGVSAVTVFTVLLFNIPYQKERLISFINMVRGVVEPQYQVLQSLICFSNGGIFGLGLGNSMQKLYFLPQPFTDFIYSIIAEEMGMIGAFIVLGLFLMIFWRGTWIALHAPDEAGKLLAVGITAAIILYAFVNIGISVNLLPVTGIPLPFVSYGGSALMMNFMGIGMLLNISKQSQQTSSFQAGHSVGMTSSVKFTKNIQKFKRRKRIGR